MLLHVFHGANSLLRLTMRRGLEPPASYDQPIAAIMVLVLSKGAAGFHEIVKLYPVWQ